jgi:DNA-directed RNA polymerase subunit alpha
MTNFDRITLQVWTDGTITPDEALRQASNVLVQHFQMIADHTGPVEVTPEVPAIAVGQTSFQIPQKIYDTPIEELDLTVRAYNCLKRSGLTKVGQVLTMSREDLLAVRNFGEKSLDELRDSLLARRMLPTPTQLERDGASNAGFGQSGLNGGVNGGSSVDSTLSDLLDEDEEE